jgi:hypothetical protein
MASALSKADEDLVHELTAWDSSGRTTEWVLCNIALVIAGILLIGSAAYTLLNLRDAVVLAVLVPGFMTGLFFVGLYVVGARRVRERHRLVQLLQRVTGLP